MNINEHHILWISYHLQGATISDIAKFGVMHVSTAFNFSKKLEERGLLSFSKRDTDKRNTYVNVTTKGEELLEEMYENYHDTPHSVIEGSHSDKRDYMVNFQISWMSWQLFAIFMEMISWIFLKDL